MVQIIDKKTSKDGSIKYLMIGNLASYYEAVVYLSPYSNKKAICISTQYGCKRQCVFCATGYTGFEGNISYKEMEDTVLLIMDDCKISHKEVELVNLMGMGEPLDNYDNVKEFLLNSRLQLCIERYALSTIGIPEKICMLADAGVNVDFTISLHFADDEIRHQYMPGTRGYKIDDIHDACIYFYNRSPQKADKNIRINYMLMKGINDDLKYADILQNRFSNKYFRINILSYNEIEEYASGLRPDDCTVQKWHDFFVNNGYEAVIRYSLGRDICGGCGQLRGKLC